MNNAGIYKASVITILKNTQNKIFLFKRKNTGWADGDYTVPSGHVDEGESPSEAAIREVYEEVGVTIKNEDLELVHVDFVKDSVIGFTFMCTAWEGNPELKERDKAEDGAWFDESNLPPNIAGHGQKILENIKAGVIFQEV